MEKEIFRSTFFLSFSRVLHSSEILLASIQNKYTLKAIKVIATDERERAALSVVSLSFQQHLINMVWLWLELTSSLSSSPL